MSKHDKFVNPDSELGLSPSDNNIPESSEDDSFDDATQTEIEDSADSVSVENLSVLQTAEEGLEEPDETLGVTSAPTPQRNQAASQGAYSIGRYQIKELLGKGAFGKVYRANDPQLDRVVAIKVLTRSQGTVDRFLREARSAANLRHPNIIPLYDYGQFDGKPTIVYQLIEGQTLSSHIEKNRPLKLADAVYIVRKIARGLDYAHEQGIIHRDVKPDNVLMDQKGEPHIADFGCAKRFTDQDVMQTMEGKTIGTPVYMSPIQASGNSHKADRRADVWSLGVILYEMIAGERPFQGSYAEVVHAIINDDPKLLRRITPKTPKDIETICSKSLSRELVERFQTAGEFADELERFEKGEPILSRRIGVLNRTWRWSKRNPAVASLIAAVFATLVLGISVSMYFGNNARNSNSARIQAALDNLQNAKSNELENILANEAKLTGGNTSPMLGPVRRLRSQKDLKPNERLRLDIVSFRLENNDTERRKYFEKNRIGQTVDSIDNCDGYELVSFVNGLREPEKQLISEELQKSICAADNKISIERRFKFQCALVQLDPEAKTWTGTSIGDLAGALTALGEVEVQQWLPVVAPIQKRLESELFRIFVNNDNSDDTSHEIAAAIFSKYASEGKLNQQFAIELLKESNAKQIAHLMRGIKTLPDQNLWAVRIRDELELISFRQNPILYTPIFPFALCSQADAKTSFIAASQKQTNLFISLLSLSNSAILKEDVWRFLQNNGDNTLVTEVVEQTAQASTPWTTVFDRISRALPNDLNPDSTAAAILSLHAYTEGQLSLSARNSLLDELLEIFKSHPSSRVHSSVRWLLWEWGFEQNVLETEKSLVSQWPEKGFGWHVDLFGNTFAIFDVENFQIRSHENAKLERNWKKWPSEGKRHRFGLCINELSHGQYMEFLNDAKNSSDAIRDNGLFVNSVDEEDDPNLPASDMRQLWAMAYCHWLTLKNRHLEQVTKPGYVELIISDTDTDTKSLIPRGDQFYDVSKTGYRLPTSAEFAFACRCNTLTEHSFGRDAMRLSKYAWFQANSGTSRKVICQLKPNEFGLFDMLGNVSERCLDTFVEKSGKISTGGIEVRGGSFKSQRDNITSDTRYQSKLTRVKVEIGFRLARTYPIEPDS